jgi:D-alanyl-D-alanine carboxypeptidase
MKLRLLPASCLLFALLISAHAQTLDKAKLDQFLDRLSEKNKAMGSLTIAKNGAVLYSRATGYREINAADKKPSTPQTRYRIGSITKMFTAAMVLQLVEEKKLKLTDTLDTFFPQVPNAKKITMAQILAHRSGIHDITNSRDYRAWKMNPKTQSEMVTIIANGTPDFEPDTKSAYSNSGFILLGYIIEKITGQTYQEALQKRITSKLGLKDTYAGTGYVQPASNESLSFEYASGWKPVTETHLSIPGGAGAIISTPNDLTRFIDALFSLKLVAKASLQQMMENKFGMEPFPLAGKTLYGHDGGIDGFGAVLVYLPEEKLAVAYASNGKVHPVGNIMEGIFDIYWNKPFTIPTFESVAVSEELLDKYVGTYSNADVPVKFTITRNAATLYVQSNGPSALPLEATAEDKFKIEVNGRVMTIEFDLSKNQMTVKRPGGERIFTKDK